MLKEYFKSSNKFEIILVLLGIMGVIVFGCIFKSAILTMICSIASIITAMLQAKGKHINIIALCRTKPNYECDFIKTDLADEKSIENTCNIINKRYKKIECRFTRSTKTRRSYL